MELITIGTLLLDTNALPQSRPATVAQMQALHTIAIRAGLTLASELQQQCGLTNPQQLAIQQASHMIDHLKQSLTPALA